MLEISEFCTSGRNPSPEIAMAQEREFYKYVSRIYELKRVRSSNSVPDIASCPSVRVSFIGPHLPLGVKSMRNYFHNHRKTPH